MATGTPRLTILLPAHTEGRDGFNPFEETLLSVLENRPAGCEIVCVHNGTYDDPFELLDEVRFVPTESKCLVDAIAAGCDAAWGRYVHVLSGGLRATSDWTDAPLDAFGDFDVGAVSSSIRYAADGDDAESPAAVSINGWTDHAAALMRSMPADQTAGRRDVTGAFLEASFWRREVLRSLTRACASVDRTAATYAYRWLSVGSGWRHHRCLESHLESATSQLPIDAIESQSFVARVRRGRTLGGIRRHFVGSASTMGNIARAMTGGTLADRVAMLLTPDADEQMRRIIEPSLVYQESGSDRWPESAGRHSQPIRRAA